MVLNDLRNTPPQNTSVSSPSSTPPVNQQVNSIHLSKQNATPTSSSTPITTSTSTSSTTSTTSPTQSSAPQPSTTSSSSSTPSVYDTNDNNIYNFPLLHGGNGNMGTGISNFFKNFNLTPGVLIIFLVVVIVFVLLFSSLTSLGKNDSSDTSSASTSTDSNGSTSSAGGNKSQIIKIIIIVLIVIAISFLYRKFEGTSIIASIKKLFTKNPQVTVTAGKTAILPMNQPANTNANGNANGKIPEIKLYKEVFNIPGNNYTYSQAQSICSAYDAKLATYDELEESYNIGAEWCNYGWSEGQMALFPTQKKTYNTLQTIKGHEHDCGRPGINGGYMANPNVRYGVNCYGHKPKRTEVEKELMENTAPYPLTKEDMLMEKQVDYWKGQLSNIIVSPFNMNRWSKF